MQSGFIRLLAYFSTGLQNGLMLRYLRETSEAEAKYAKLASVF